ncbi:MAG: hypothetical protein KGK16_06215 [Bradyrhizobium sp.]|nr:hypothetical protein [Bradyrhizobium sp.]
MVEKIVTSGPNVVDFARYQQVRNAAGKTLGLETLEFKTLGFKTLGPIIRTCRYCGAALSEGENDDDCSSAFNIGAARRVFAD